MIRSIIKAINLLEEIMRIYYEESSTFKLSDQVAKITRDKIADHDRDLLNNILIDGKPNMENDRDKKDSESVKN